MSVFRYFRAGYDGHSNTNAYLLSLLSYYVYTKKDVAGNPSIPGSGNHSNKFRKLFQDLSAEDPFKIRTAFSSATEWAVLSNSKMVIVVFRGTDDDLIPEWKSNISYKLRTAPKSWGGNVRVHSGFYSTLSGVYQTIRQEVRNRNDSGRIPVYLTGLAVVPPWPRCAPIDSRKWGEYRLQVFMFLAHRVSAPFKVGVTSTK